MLANLCAVNEFPQGYSFAQLGAVAEKASRTVDPLIESYQQDLKREMRKLKKPTVYGTPTQADLRAAMAYRNRMLDLVEAGNHLAFARRMDAQGKPTRLVRAVIKSATRCLYPRDPEQRSRENMERFTVPAEFNVDRPRKMPKHFRGDLHNEIDYSDF